jgi:hypothetical protein
MKVAPTRKPNILHSGALLLSMLEGVDFHHLRSPADEVRSYTYMIALAQPIQLPQKLTALPTKKA